MSKISDIARKRITLKLLPDAANPLPTGRLSRTDVENLVEAAGWAPFHRASHTARSGADSPVEPWRFHMLDDEGCRALISQLYSLPKPPSKIANMLAAADAMLLVTWLPEPSESGAWEANELNLEHIAAGAAAVQTLLLAATEQGIGSYWSSGGVLATQEAFDLLGIPRGEAFLGAIFLFPEPPEGVEVSPGKLRGQRDATASWSRWVAVSGR